MICTKILGKKNDSEFSGKAIDYVDFEWHETYSKLHRKSSRGGRDIAISLDDSILKIGINLERSFEIFLAAPESNDSKAPRTIVPYFL